MEDIDDSWYNGDVQVYSGLTVLTKNFNNEYSVAVPSVMLASV